MRRAEERRREVEEEQARQEARLELELRKVQEQQAAKVQEASPSKARRPSRFAVSSVPGEAGGLPDPAPHLEALRELSQGSVAEAGEAAGPPAKIKGILKNHTFSNFTIHGDPSGRGSSGASPYTTVTGAASDRWRNTVQNMQQMFTR